MNNNDIIKAGRTSFDTLIELIKKRIKFDELEPYKLKAVVEGKKLAFEVANSQLTKIRQMEEGDDTFNEDVYKSDLNRLIDSTSFVLTEIKKVLENPISVNDSDDDKVKAIVQSKDLAFDLLVQIKNVKDDIEDKIKNNRVIDSKSRNFATERVKK